MILIYTKKLFFIGILIIFFILSYYNIAILSSNRIFPQTDEWSYIEIIGNQESIIKYLFAQHVDHRIPIQKLLHLVLLRLSGFDFRVLIAVNMLFAAATAVVLMMIAQRYRGRTSIGDLAIPFFCMNFGAGMSLMGFHFQFLSFIFFITLAILFIIRYSSNKNNRELNYSFGCLFAASWCGLNGVIVTIILSLAFSYYFWRYQKESLSLINKVLLLSAFLMGLFQIILWKPSHTLTGHTQLNEVFRYFWGLFTSSMPIYARTGNLWKTMVLLVVLIIGVYNGLGLLRKERNSLANFVLLSALAATLILMVIVSFGRAPHGGWVPWGDQHYGYLTIFIPIISWILCSKNLSHINEIIAGALFVLLSVSAFSVSAKWRIPYASESGPRFRDAQQAILSKIDPIEVVNKYLKYFYSSDSPQIRDDLVIQITKLRRIGGWEYKIAENKE